MTPCTVLFILEGRIMKKFKELSKEPVDVVESEMIDYWKKHKVFEKSIEVLHPSNTALLKYLYSFLVQLGSRPCYTRRLSSHYKKAVVRVQEGRPSYHYSPF